MRRTQARTQVRENQTEHGSGTLAVLWRTFIKENKVIPPVLAVVSLLIFSWVVAGAFIGGPGDPTSSSQSIAPDSGEFAQSETDDEAATSVPEIDNPNAESFAAYESKDPFRSLFAPAEEENGTEDGSDESTDDGSASEGEASGGAGDSEDANSGYGGGSPSEDGGPSGGGSGDDGDEDGPRRDRSSAPANVQYDREDTYGDDRSDFPEAQGDGSGADDSGASDELFDSGGDLPSPAR